MDAKAKDEGKIQRIIRYQRAFIFAGWLFAFFAFIASIISLFAEPGLILNIILFLQGVLDIGIFLFAYGLAAIREKDGIYLVF